MVVASRRRVWSSAGRCWCIPVDELEDHSVGVAHLEGPLALLLHPQRHGDPDAFALQPGKLFLKVVETKAKITPSARVSRWSSGNVVRPWDSNTFMPTSSRLSELNPSAAISSRKPKCCCRKRLDAAAS